MTKQEFLLQFEEVLGAEPGTLTAETNLTSHPGWDSVAYLSTLVLIDDQCGINLPPDALMNARFVGDILKLLGAKLEP